MRQWNIYIAPYEFLLKSHTLYKNQLKMEHRPKFDTIKFLDENTGENIYDLGMEKFLKSDIKNIIQKNPNNIIHKNFLI